MSNIDLIRGNLDKLRFDTPEKGLSVAPEMDDIYTLKLGYPLVIYGLPNSGKSYLWFIWAINMSRKHGFKHYLFTPEMGNKAEIVEALMNVYTQKDLRMQKEKGVENRFAMSMAEYETAFNFIRSHFYIAERSDFGKEDVTIQDVYKNVSDAEAEAGFTFNTIAIDPFIEIHIESRKNRSDLDLADVLTKIREYDAANKTTTVIVNHTRDIQPLWDKGLQVSYFPIPTPAQMAGGQMWYRKMFAIICLYKPLAQVFGTSDNEMWIMVQKAKPKGYCKLGKCVMFWNGSKHNLFPSNNTNTYENVRLPYFDADDNVKPF